MKGGSKLFIFAGVALALVAIVLGIASFAGGGKSDAKSSPKSGKVTVVEAVNDIAPYAILAPEDLVEKQVATADAPADAATSIAAVVGQAYKAPLVRGQRLQMTQLQTPGLRNEIAVGKRAIALPVDEVSAMSGLVQDGDFVDLVFHSRINLVRVVTTTALEIPEDAVYSIKNPVVLPPDLEQPNHPPTGDPGSKFYIRDDVGDAQNLEPVVKVMLQDIHVLRVIQSGEQFSGNGEQIQQAVAEGGTVTEKPKGQLILEVTPEQAEMITFMQDKHHEYQVVVRGKEDHETVTTTGITFEMLATNPDWALPWPETVTAPKAQRSQTNANSDDATETEPASDEAAESGG